MKEMMTVVMAMSLRATRVVRFFRFSEPTEALFDTTIVLHTVELAGLHCRGQKAGKLMERGDCDEGSKEE